MLISNLIIFPILEIFLYDALCLLFETLCNSYFTKKLKEDRVPTKK